MVEIAVRDVIAKMEEYAPISLQGDFDNCGLKCGDINMPVTGVLVTVDTTLDVINEAVRKGCNMIIEHHPIIFSPIKKLDYELPSIQAVVSAVKKDIAIYSAHTNVDFVKGGLNDTVAEKMGLSEVVAISGDDGPRMGKLDKPVSLKEYAEFLGAVFDDKNILTVGCGDRMISKVAVINGGGGSPQALFDAINANADIFVTGDVKYSLARLAKDLDYAIIIFGHFESEFEFIALIQKELSRRIPGIKVLGAETCKSPYNQRSGK